MDIKDIFNGKELHGTVSYKAYDKEGNIVATGTHSNNIVKGIRLPIITLLAGKINDDKENLPFVSYIKLGSGTTTPTELDTDVETVIPNSQKETFNKPQISTDGPSVTFSFLYDATDSYVDGKEIHEMGLFTKNDTMVARTTVGTWKKVSGLYFEVYWTIGYTA